MPVDGKALGRKVTDMSVGNQNNSNDYVKTDRNETNVDPSTDKGGYVKRVGHQPSINRSVPDSLFKSLIKPVVQYPTQEILYRSCLGFGTPNQHLCCISWR